MAVDQLAGPITEFEQWYEGYEINNRTGCLDPRDVSKPGQAMYQRYLRYKTEMDTRVANYEILEKIGDGEVIKERPDLPNVSSGETAGLIRRTARNLVQNTPNVEVLSIYDDDKVKGVFLHHVLKTKIIGSDEYSNDMQQNLFASTKTALTLGFNTVIPVLLQNADGSWYMQYDTIHYRDVFPEPGAKDIRRANDVFVRRYLTKGDVRALIRDNAVGWDVNALRALLATAPAARDRQSLDHQTKKRGASPHGYEIITWYSSSGDAFLTFDPRTKFLLRIEKNKHPKKKHPVHFLVLEKDENQPLGKSQVELLIGRQDFQDLMLNGAMKLWYRNINPPIIGYGTVNAAINLSPGKYNEIANPNAKIEPFEVNTGTLMQYGQISQQNLGSMVNLMGSADQQMATQAGNGMSATPQGVEAQQAMVDITTNNYQKAIESFFSHYCSYALTIYFEELKAAPGVVLTADTRKQMLDAGLDAAAVSEDGTLDIDFKSLAGQEYFVRCVPGSLVELEDEKQIRLLNSMFIPLSQAMPALAAAQDPAALANASRAMQFIIAKQIELSGASAAVEIKQMFQGSDGIDERIQSIEQVETRLDSFSTEAALKHDDLVSSMAEMRQQISQMVELNGTLLEKLGVLNPATAEQSNSSGQSSPQELQAAPNVLPASA